LKYILDSPMQNKKTQLCIAGYNCKVEYIEGRNNCCVDLLSRLIRTDKDVAAQDATQETEEETPDIDDRALDVSALNSNKFRPRDFASCEVEPPDDLMKPHTDLPKEQDRDQDVVKLRARLSIGKGTKTEREHFLVIDEVLYHLSSAKFETLHILRS